MQTSLLHSLLFLGLAGGCVASGQAGYTATGTVSVPEMVVISPGVQVIADYNEPIFYSDSYYWRQENGYWLRSRTHSVFRTEPSRLSLSQNNLRDSEGHRRR